MDCAECEAWAVCTAETCPMSMEHHTTTQRKPQQQETDFREWLRENGGPEWLRLTNQ